MGDKISNGNAFRGIVEPYCFEPCTSDSEDECRSVRENENPGRMFTTAKYGLIFRSIVGL